MIPTILPVDYVDTLSYSGNWPSFPLHGTVDLIDCIDCVAEENEDDGSSWELELVYPLGGYGFNELALDKIILAKANSYQDPQAFRIYSIEKNISKTVTVKAQHISYDMINVPVKPFTSTSASDALTKLRNNSIYGNNWKQHHFYFDTNVTQSGEFNPDTPTSMRAMLLDGDDSIKGTFGGDLVFDNYHISLLSVGGQDRYVTINYGVDMIDMTQEQNNSEMITGILPYYKRSTNDSQYSSEPIIYGSIVYGPGQYLVQKIEAVDLTDQFPNNAPTVSQLTDKGQEWVNNEEIGIPEISLTVQYATLGQDVRIHDAIRVCFPKMGIDTKAKVVKYKYNVLLERCEEVEVGHAKDSNYFNLMDASKLRRGLIPPARIQNESITNEKIAKGGVGSGKLAPNSVSTGNVELGAIDHKRLSGADGVGEPAVQADVIDTGAVTNEKIGRGAVTGDKVSSKTIGKSHMADRSVDSTILDYSAVKEGNIENAAVAWAKLKSGSGQPATKINALETDMAYVNKLFASSAQIDFIRVQALYANTASIGGALNVTGTSQVAGVNCSSLTVRGSGDIVFKGYGFTGTTLVEDYLGNLVRVIRSA